MNVKELIDLLKTFDPELLVAYELFSEATLMELSDIGTVDWCKPRPDGWIARPRKDKETQTYLMFAGN